MTAYQGWAQRARYKTGLVPRLQKNVQSTQALKETREANKQIPNLIQTQGNANSTRGTSQPVRTGKDSND